MNGWKIIPASMTWAVCACLYIYAPHTDYLTCPCPPPLGVKTCTAYIVRNILYAEKSILLTQTHPFYTTLSWKCSASWIKTCVCVAFGCKISKKFWKMALANGGIVTIVVDEKACNPKDMSQIIDISSLGLGGTANCSFTAASKVGLHKRRSTTLRLSSRWYDNQD